MQGDGPPGAPLRTTCGGLLAREREYGGVDGTVQNIPGKLLEIFSSLSVSDGQTRLLPPFRMSIIFNYNADLPFCVLP